MFWTHVRLFFFIIIIISNIADLQGKSDRYIVNEPQKSINYCFNGLQN